MRRKCQGGRHIGDIERITYFHWGHAYVRNRSLSRECDVVHVRTATKTGDDVIATIKCFRTRTTKRLARADSTGDSVRLSGGTVVVAVTYDVAKGIPERNDGLGIRGRDEWDGHRLGREGRVRSGNSLSAGRHTYGLGIEGDLGYEAVVRNAKGAAHPGSDAGSRRDQNVLGCLILALGDKLVTTGKIASG